MRLTQTVIERLKKQARQEFRRELEPLRAKFKLRLEAIDWLAQENIQRAPRQMSGLMPQTVRHLIPLLPATFTRADVASFLANHDPDLAKRIHPATLTNLLSRLAAQGEIKLIRPGRGSRGALFSREDADDDGKSLDSDPEM
jgi:hypothetical protein